VKQSHLPECQNCKHWHKNEAHLSVPPKGDCRRHPPTVALANAGIVTLYPVTHSGFPACGEFAVKPLVASEGP
jgi:hypothetical protein